MKRVLALYACAVVAFILAPIVVVIVSSFGAGDVTEFPLRFSMRWYGHALTQQIFIDAARNSAWLAAVATVVATPIALAASIAIVRHRFPGRDAMQSFLLVRWWSRRSSPAWRSWCRSRRSARATSRRG